MESENISLITVVEVLELCNHFHSHEHSSVLLLSKFFKCCENFNAIFDKYPNYESYHGLLCTCPS